MALNAFHPHLSADQMVPAQDATSQNHQPDSPRSPEPDPNMAIQCRAPSLNQLHHPAVHSSISTSAPNSSRPFQGFQPPTSNPSRHLSTSQQVLEPGRASMASARTDYLGQRCPRHLPLHSSLGAKEGIVTAPTSLDYQSSNFHTIDNDSKPEPALKRPRLSDDGWIPQALEQGRINRGGEDPNPIPQLTPPPGHGQEPSTHMRQLAFKNQQHAQSPPNWLGSSIWRKSPSARSIRRSRRPSSPCSTSSPTHSPALTHRSVTSATRQSAISPPDGSVVGGFSDLGIVSRADSIAADDAEYEATFRFIHKVPRVVIPPVGRQMAADLSVFEKLPKQLFMRIIMYCGYKEHCLLKKCSYNLYLAVDLSIIPWEIKTEAILFEECYNPRNFRNITDDDDDVAAGVPKASVTKRKARAPANSSSPKSASGKVKGKGKAKPDTYGKWGCYCCYQILPAYYFEGALLEDKDKAGRTPKNNRIRGTNASEADKKVDMRVEYVQVLAVVPGTNFPNWLSSDKMEIDAAEVETYVRERGRQGVNCDDLKVYFKDITKKSHLIAPVWGITPVFTPSTMIIPEVDLKMVSQARKPGTVRSPQSTRTPLPATQTREEEQSNLDNESEVSRPLYKVHSGNTTQGDTDTVTYAYELRIPRDAKREDQFPQLAKSQPVSKLCLPPKTSAGDQPLLAPGDVISLRRVCILCGTKFAIYRRDCNRKIISKTDEQWWPCDCPEVRAAGKSTDCSTCGRKVIY